LGNISKEYGMADIARQPCDESLIQCGSYGQQETQTHIKRWTLAATIISSSMVFINGSTVNVALPAFQRDLGASVTDIQWIVNIYTLMLASLMLLGGTLGDHIGRKRTFLTGTVIFTIASIACGLTNTTESLILFRAIQGIGGALLTPGSLAILSAVYPTQERGAAIGLWSGFTALTSAIGPLLGGWLIDNLSWRYIFFIHVPLALIVILISLRYMPESRDEEVEAGLDWGGAFLATVGLGSFTFGLISANNSSWIDPLVIGSLVGGLALLGIFLRYEIRHPAPMVPLQLFQSRNFSGANLLTLLLYAALSGALFFLPLNLQQVQGYSATAAGAAFLPFILLLSLLSSWSGRLVDRIGARTPLLIGSLLAAAGFALFALPEVGGTYWTTFFPPVVMLGLGFAVAVAPLTTTVMTSVADHYAGTASGINNSISRLASLLAVAVFGFVMLNSFTASLEGGLSQSILKPVEQNEIMQQRSKLAAIQPPESLSLEQKDSAQAIVHSAFVSGFRLVAIACAGLAVGAAILAWFVIETVPR
jgi:EmrB/QacA subfamily drug resistance transporter